MKILQEACFTLCWYFVNISYVSSAHISGWMNSFDDCHESCSFHGVISFPHVCLKYSLSHNTLRHIWMIICLPWIFLNRLFTQHHTNTGTYTYTHIDIFSLWLHNKPINSLTTAAVWSKWTKYLHSIWNVLLDDDILLNNLHLKVNFWGEKV